jgi:hypothetical protein
LKSVEEMKLEKQIEGNGGFEKERLPELKP